MTESSKGEPGAVFSDSSNIRVGSLVFLKKKTKMVTNNNRSVQIQKGASFIVVQTIRTVSLMKPLFRHAVSVGEEVETATESCWHGAPYQVMTGCINSLGMVAVEVRRLEPDSTGGNDVFWFTYDNFYDDGSFTVETGQ